MGFPEASVSKACNKDTNYRPTKNTNPTYQLQVSLLCESPLSPNIPEARPSACSGHPKDGADAGSGNFSTLASTTPLQRRMERVARDPTLTAHLWSVKTERQTFNPSSQNTRSGLSESSNSTPQIKTLQAPNPRPLNPLTLKSPNTHNP